MAIQNAHKHEFEGRATELAKRSNIFRKPVLRSNGLILRILALSHKPLDQFTIRMQIASEGMAGSTVSRRLPELTRSPKPFVKEISTRPSRRGKTIVSVYDLTLRGWVAALLLLDMNRESEVIDYAKSVGRSTDDDVLAVLRHLAEVADFFPYVKSILRFFRDDFEAGLTGLDVAKDAYISSAFDKDFLDWFRGNDAPTNDMNEWLHSHEYRNMKDEFPNDF